MPHSEKELVGLSLAKGVANRTSEADTPPGAARAIINLDVLGSSLIVRRGRQTVYPGAGIHSLWSAPGLDFGLFVQDDTLYYFGESGEVAALRSGLHLRDVDYAFVGGNIYYSNGVETGCVTAGGVHRPWGVATPDDSYTAAFTTDGGMDAGEYYVSLTYMAGREESGASLARAVQVPQNGGITLSQLPTNAPANATALRVYVSPANDPRLFHARDVALGMDGVAINAGPRGKLLDTSFLVPAPPGRFVMAMNGRIFSASGRYLRWTEALRYGLYDPANNYLTAPRAITALAAPERPGFVLFVGTSEKTYVYQGDDIASATMVTAKHVGIIPGSVAMVRHDALDIQGVTYDCPVWLGTNGVPYVGTEVGVLPLSKTAVSKVYGKVASAFFDMDGAARYIAAGTGGKQSSLAVKDRLVARVVELGTSS